MIIYHADKNSLPQQVQENLENILKIAGVVREIYTTSQELDSSVQAVNVSDTTIDVDNFTTGYLLDTAGNLFNIISISSSGELAYISFMTTLRGEQGEQGVQGIQGESGINAMTGLTFTKSSLTYADGVANVTGTFTISDEDGTKDVDGTIEIPIVAGENITIDANETNDGIIVTNTQKVYEHICGIKFTDANETNEIDFQVNIITSQNAEIFSDNGTGQELWDILVKNFNITNLENTSYAQTISRTPANAYLLDDMVDVIVRFATNSDNNLQMTIAYSVLAIDNGTAKITTSSFTGVYDDFNDEKYTRLYEHIIEL